MATSFNANRTWEEAVRMLKGNRELILVLAGLFLFLPTFAAYVLVPEIATGPADLDPENPVPALSAYLERNGVLLVVLQVLQAMGVLSILALISRRRPTVAQAIATAATALLPLIAAQLLLGIAVVLGLGLVLSAAALAGPVGLTLFVAAAIVIMLYLFGRFSTLMPILIFDEVRNPLRAIAESWRLTRGHGSKLMGFLALVMVAMLVISVVVGFVSTLITALSGEGGSGFFVAGAVNAVLGAVLQVVMAAIFAGIYRQLNAGESPTSALDPNG